MGVNYLLDTHTLLWWLFDDPKLSVKARKIISAAKHRIIVSSASAWEISTKYRLGKLPEVGDIIENFIQYLRKGRFEMLGITIEHGLHAGLLLNHHRDPFDRMLIAQAQLENLTIITTDHAFQDFDVKVVW